MIKSPLELRQRFFRSGTALSSTNKNLRVENLPTDVAVRWAEGVAWCEGIAFAVQLVHGGFVSHGLCFAAKPGCEGRQFARDIAEGSLGEKAPASDLSSLVPTFIRTRYHHGVDVALDAAFFKDDFSRLFKSTGDQLLAGARHTATLSTHYSRKELTSKAPRHTRSRRRRPCQSVAALHLRLARTVRCGAPITGWQRACAVLEVMCRYSVSWELSKFPLFVSASSFKCSSKPHADKAPLCTQSKCADIPLATEVIPTNPTTANTFSQSHDMPWPPQQTDLPHFLRSHHEVARIFFLSRHEGAHTPLLRCGDIHPNPGPPVMHVHHTVGPFGAFIDGEILERLLKNDVIGDPPDGTVIMCPQIACSLFVAQQIRTDENLLLASYPNARKILLPVCIGSEDSMGPRYASGSHSISGHFVLVHVDVRTRNISLYDSLEDHDHTFFVQNRCPTLAINIWGTSQHTFFQYGTRQQQIGSNDCAIFVLKNICSFLTMQGHVFGNHMPTIFTRESFRLLWNLVSQEGALHRPLHLLNAVQTSSPKTNSTPSSKASPPPIHTKVSPPISKKVLVPTNVSPPNSTVPGPLPSLGLAVSHANLSPSPKTYSTTRYTPSSPPSKTKVSPPILKKASIPTYKLVPPPRHVSPPRQVSPPKQTPPRQVLPPNKPKAVPPSRKKPLPPPPLPRPSHPIPVHPIPVLPLHPIPVPPISKTVSPPKSKKPAQPASSAQPKGSLLEHYEHDAIDALKMLYNRTNLSSFVKMKFSKSDTLVGEFLDKELELIESIQHRTNLTEQAKRRLEADPVVCGSCGIFCIDRKNVIQIPRNSNLLNVFRWDISKGDPPQGCVVPGHEVVDDDGKTLLLYPEGVSDYGVWCCKPCMRKAKKQKVPVFSMINGVCFGRIADLPKLSFVEVMAISRSRLFTTTVQIVPMHKTKLHGTCISFPQDGPEVLCNVLPRPLKDITSNINVIFVGTEEDWINRRRDILSKYYPHLYTSFQVRPERILQWLVWLKSNHKDYADISISSENCDQLHHLPTVILDDAHVCYDEDLATLHHAATSDVANNRMQAGDASSEPVTAENVGRADHVEHVMITGVSVPKDIDVLKNLATLCLDGNHDEERPIFHCESDQDASHDVLQPASSGNNESASIRRQAAPQNEFTHGGYILSTSFPTLFLLGLGTFDGKLSQAEARYLMLHHSGRFARDPRFVFYVHNMLQRHAAIRQVKGMSLCGTDEEKESMLTKLNSQTFKRRLNAAEKEPPFHASSEEKIQWKKERDLLLREVAPYLKSGCRTVPNGPSHHGKNLSELHAMVHFMGLPGLFVTVAPADFNDLFVMKMTLIADGPPTQLVIPLLSESVVSSKRRWQVAADNPAFCAESFQHLLDVIVEELYGMCMHYAHKKAQRPGQGIFGTTRAHYAVTEAQARGTLHWHQLLWLNASPEILERSLRSLDLQQRITRIVTAWITNNIPMSCLREVVVPQKKGEKTVFAKPLSDEPRWLHSEGISIPGEDGFFERVHAIATNSNMHDPEHKPTCAKGPQGRIGCRLCMKKPVWDRTRPMSLHINDGELKACEVDLRDYTDCGPFIRPADVIVWEEERNPWSVYLSPFNKDLCNVCCCNTNVQTLGAASQARSAIYYLASYLDKDKHVISAALASLSEALRHVSEYPSTATDTGTTKRKFCHTVQRWVNNLVSRHEVSSQQAAATSLGFGTTSSSDLFWYCFPKQAENLLRQKFPREFLHIEDYTDVQHLHTIIREDFHEVDDVVEAHLDFEDENEATETLEHLVRDKDAKISVCAQHTHFFHAPEPIKSNMSLYEFCALFVIVKMDSGKELVDKDDGSEDDEDIPGLENENTDENTPGRKKNLRINFPDSHPLYLTHCLQLRSKHRIPNISGRIPFHPGPSPCKSLPKYKTWLSKLRSWAIFCHVTFLPWDASLSRRLRNPIRELDNWTSRVLKTDDEVNLSRYQVMVNTTICLRSSVIEKSMCSTWRMRDRDLWEDYGCHAPKWMPHGKGKIKPGDIHKAIDLMRALSCGSITHMSASVTQLRMSLSKLFPQTASSNYEISSPQVLSKEEIELQQQTIVNEGEKDRARRAAGHFTSEDSFLVHALNVQQQSVFKKVCTWMNSDSTNAPLICMLGGPGTGKSEVAKTVINTFPSSTISSAYNGSSASILNGATICHTFQIGSYAEGGDYLKPMSTAALEIAKLEWENIRLVIIDEVSQITERVLRLISERLKMLKSNQKVFGGIAVLLCGDLFQLSPVFGDALYASTCPTFSLFKRNMTILTIQQRSDDDRHTANINCSRNISPGCEFPFRTIDWKIYKSLSKSDVSGTGTFMDATHLCATNDERAVLNRVLAEDFGRRHGKQVLRWRHEVPAWVASIGEDSTADNLWQLLANHEEFFGLFVEGAPAFLTKNFCVRKKLCNGTPCKMMSVGYHSAASQADYYAAVASSNLPVVMVPRPDYIIVECEGVGLIPVSLTDTAKLKLAKKKFEVQTHGVEIGFACTLHKAQGRTLKKVVLHVSPSSVLYTASVHVGMTRVEKAENLRIFPIPSIAHVLNKTWHPGLKELMNDIMQSS